MNFTKLKRIFEKNGLTISRKKEDSLWYYLAEGWTTMGQNIIFETSVRKLSEFISDFKNHVDNYDCSSEAYIWLDDFGHGKNGAPYDMKDVYSDMEEVKTRLESIAYDLLEE